MYKILILILIPLLSACILNAQDDKKGTTLEYCIQSALNFNPLVKTATLEYSVSLADVKTVTAQKYPSIEGNISAGYADQYHKGNNYQARNGNLTMNQFVWQNNRLNAAVKKQNFTAQSRYQLSLSAKNDLILSVKTAFYKCIEDSMIYKAYRENTAQSNLILQYANERFKVGMARGSDVTRAESDLTGAEFEMNTVLNDFKESRYYLSLLTGIDVSDLRILIAKTESVPVIDFENHDSIMEQAIMNYPQLNAIRNTNLAKKQNTREIKASLFPELMITGGYDWNYTPAAGNVNGWYGLATLRWNIFNGFEKKYRVQAAIINQEASESGIQEAELNIRNELNIQLINLNEAKSQIHVTEKWMQNTFENLASAEAQYKAGTGSMLELTDARVKNLTAKQNHIKAITTYLITIANIERLTGNTIKNENE